MPYEDYYPVSKVSTLFDFNPKSTMDSFHPGTMLLLARSYFRCLNIYIPIINPRLFFAYFNETNPSLPKQAVIAAVCLSGACLNSHLPELKDITQRLTIRLGSLFIKVYRMPCIQTVQAFLIAAKIEIAQLLSPFLPNDWTSYSIAYNMACMLSLNNSCYRLKPIQQEERTRTWMALYIVGIAYFLFKGRHYYISSDNSSVPFWVRNDTASVDSSSFRIESKHLVHSFRNKTVFWGIIEALTRAKYQYMSVAEKQPKAAHSFNKKIFYAELDKIEKWALAWYLFLPPFLKASPEKDIISTPSPQNSISCELYLTFLYNLLEINRLRLEPEDPTNTLSRLLDSKDQLRSEMTTSDFLQLSTLEKCVFASHLCVLTTSSTCYRGKVFQESTFKWIYAFQITLFIRQLKQNLLPPAILNLLDMDEKNMLNLMKSGASRFPIINVSIKALEGASKHHSKLACS
ncbi:hypothetical protein DSO57_1028770 [Entomophthora muscae]|uniref:Uncharacterized protein n=1 Tax=Entomophthora muscae TaxID=34485 RepID=A0ACC2T1M9_9FUNG|nr:hypothetical protein DSO57_1028770 [Entomophthora muscae]